MTRWHTVATIQSLVTAAGVAAVALAVPVHGQSRPRTETPRLLEVFSNQGSRLGVSVRDLEDEDAKRVKLPALSGVLVEEVSSNSPAETAGFKIGDVVVDFDGERVRGTRQFIRLVQETPSGRSVQATVVRDGQSVNLTVEPRDSRHFSYFSGLDRLDDLKTWTVPPAIARPTPAPPRVFEFDEFLGRGSGRLGITVSDLSSQLAAHFGAKDGVLVSSVTDGSPASKIGIRAGDVITAINGSRVTTPAELRRESVRLDDGDEVTIDIVRDRKNLTLKGKMELTQTRRGARTVI